MIILFLPTADVRNIDVRMAPVTGCGIYDASSKHGANLRWLNDKVRVSAKVPALFGGGGAGMVSHYQKRSKEA